MMDYGSQLVMLVFWLLRLVLGLAAAFLFIVFIVDRWWLKNFDLVEELKGRNYAVAGLVAVVIYAVLRNVG